MTKHLSTSSRLLFLLAVAALLLPAVASAIVPPEQVPPFPGRKASAVDLEAHPSLERIERGSARATEIPGLQRFFAHHSADWEVRWDARNDRPNLVEGAGVPLVPGRGNGLARAGEVTTADVERGVRGFLAEFPDLLDVEGLDLRLRPEGTVNVGVDNHLWFVELQQFHNGVPVEGAIVYFRVNHGNLVQFGAEKVAPVRIPTNPRVDAVGALAAVVDALAIDPSEISEIVEPGALKIIPALPAGERVGERFAGSPGRGYRHLLVWEVAFRREGNAVTYEGVVDARTGDVLQLADRNAYAQVTGGIYPTTNTDPEIVVGFPFNSVSNGTTKVTDAGGNYSYGGGTATSTLNGRYIKISDACGAISLSDGSTGNLAFGTSGGTDCTTPGVGGAGNTHAARSGFYHLTNINRKAASYHPSNSWLNGTLTSNMNINSTCNAFWNGSTVNFYRSGGGCSNTGEIAAVFLHEWGHGMDTNTGGAASEQGSGEAVGDTFAFLETKDSCIGPNFQPGVNCFNCTACTGVRDVKEFSLQGSRTIAKPSTVADNNGINCDRYSCPYYQFWIFGAYQGPMGYQGHCESYIASSANWDLAQALVSRWGSTAGWQKMDAIWYGSLVPSKSAYQVASGGKCNPSATVNGCGSTNWYTVFLAVDDDDGNLSNGTPNGCRIWDAYNAHGIACGSRPACTQ
jgi:trimeric autotransporter adhesin